MRRLEALKDIWVALGVGVFCLDGEVIDLVLEEICDVLECLKRPGGLDVHARRSLANGDAPNVEIVDSINAVQGNDGIPDLLDVDLEWSSLKKDIHAVLKSWKASDANDD